MAVFLFMTSRIESPAQPRSNEPSMLRDAICLVKRAKLLLLALAAGWGMLAGAAAADADVPVFTPHDEHRQSLAPYLYVLDDTPGTLTVEQVAAGQGGEFQPLRPDKVLGYNYPHKALWLRVVMDFSLYRGGARSFITYDHEHIGNLRLYRVTQQGIQRVELDESLPREGRLYHVREYMLPVEPTASPGGPEVFYLRLGPHTRYVRAEFSWSGTQGVVEAVHDHALIYGLFFGGLVVMWLYNLTLYLYLRDRAYLYYGYYLGCFTATFLHVYGLSTLLMPLNPMLEQLFAACGYGAVHGMVLFTRNFLALRTSARWIDHYLHVSQWVLLGGAALAFVQPVGRPFVYLSYLLLLVVPGMVLGGVIRWAQGYTPARVFSLGWAIFGAALGLRAAQTVGLVPESIVTSHAVMVASVLEAIIFSIALAYRIKLMEAERNEALDRTARRELEILESERSTLERRVAERTQSLNDLLEARRMMLANVSHELRSPVNALRLLLDACVLNSHRDMPQMLNNARSITNHMSQLVENLLLLDIERQRAATGGGAGLMIQSFDLGDEIATTAQLLGPLRQKSAASLNVDVQSCRGMAVRGDLTSVRRILINLLSNAFKFTQYGSVSLHTRIERPQPGRVLLTLQVVDTGQGIPTAMQAQIFEAFVTSGPESGHTGTGLGLAISLQLARHLGGDLRMVSSVPGEGSTFECQLPFELADAAEVQGAQPLAPPPTRSLTVLLAEDCPITAEAVKVILNQLRHKVVHVDSFSALDHALDTRLGEFDVALVDHRLPGGLGLDLIKSLHARAASAGLTPGGRPRFILMTADVTPELLATARLVCSDIVTKPTTAAVLQQLLGRGPQPAAAPLPPPLFHLDSPVVDAGPLSMLRSAGAGPQALAELVARFEETVGGQLRVLMDRLYVVAHASPLPIQEIAEVVHRLRSACLTVGAVALADAIQQWVHMENPRDAVAHSERVMHAFHQTSDALSQLLRQLQHQPTPEP